MTPKTPNVWFSKYILGFFIICSVGMCLPADANGPIKLTYPKRIDKIQTKDETNEWTENTLLIMPHKPGNEDTLQLIRDVNGTIVRTIGSGDMTTWVVTFKLVQEFAKAEKKLSKNRQVKCVQRDYIFHSKLDVNDPYFGQEWHLSALNVPNAWDVSLGGTGITIGIIDTGVTTQNTDLIGKIYAGYDAVNRVDGQSDVAGHGTMCSTTAAASTNNGICTAAPARLAKIYPVRSGKSDGSFSSAALIEGIDHIGNLPVSYNVKLINLSVNGTPPNTLVNPNVNSVIHTYFQWFHNTKGGLIFNAAGNDSLEDTNPLVPYLIVCSAIDSSYSLAEFSNYGSCIWFTAPGDGIYCSKGTNTVVSVSGTSFSTPLACSIAALIWGAKPSLTNTQVEQIMKKYVSNLSTSWNKYYGYGLPDAAACVTAALNATSPSSPAPLKKKSERNNKNKLWKR